MITKSGKEVCAVGHRVILRLADDVADSEIKDGALKGFQMDVGDDFKRQKASSVIGEVVDIGPMAWRAFDGDSPEWKPWAKLGDIVYFAKYGGKFITIDEEEYVIINDEDLQVVIKES